MAKQILIFENSHSITNFLIRKWNEICEEAIRDHNTFNVALSGGQSPIEFFSRLSISKDFKLWEKTHIFQVDERFVPPDDPQNNFKSIQDNLLQFISIPQENIHSINTKCETVAVSANTYAQELAAYFRVVEKGELPKFDLCMLGIGEDGHTASLFPGEEIMVQSDILTLPVSSSSLKEERVSISLPVINSAHHVIFLILGKGKAKIMNNIFEGDLSCPASHVDNTEGNLLFLLDSPAASKLKYEENYTHMGEAISLDIQ